MRCLTCGAGDNGELKPRVSASSKPGLPRFMQPTVASEHLLGKETAAASAAEQDRSPNKGVGGYDSVAVLAALLIKVVVVVVVVDWVVVRSIGGHHVVCARICTESAVTCTHQRMMCMCVCVRAYLCVRGCVAVCVRVNAWVG